MKESDKLKDFKIDRAVEEITIDGDPYEIDLSDKKKKRYAEIGEELRKTGKKMESLGNIEDSAQLQEQFDILKEKTQKAMDEILGKGAFDEIYEKTNEALENTLDVLFDVLGYINERYQEKFKEKKAKYVKKKR